MKRIGLIAGRGRFPLIFSRAAKEKGLEVIALGIKGDTAAELKKTVDKLYWLKFNELSRVPGIFESENVREAVMAGQVNPLHLFDKKLCEDQELKGVIDRLVDKRTDTIFRAIIDNIESKGVKFLDSTLFLKHLLPSSGVLGSARPTASQSEDIKFGFDIAKAIGGIDIGQTVCIKDRAIVAVEALEGTDNTIRRAGRISRGGFSAVKVSKPGQDMRFDVPVVGVRTLKTLRLAKGAALAVEAGRTLVLDKDDFLRRADRWGIVVEAV